MVRSRPLARWGFAALLCVAPLGVMPPTASAAITFVQQVKGNAASATSLPSTSTSREAGALLRRINSSPIQAGGTRRRRIVGRRWLGRHR